MQYKIEKASITNIGYRIRGASLRLTLTWEGLGDETILAHWADGRIATATRSGMALESIQATSDQHELDIEHSGEVSIRLLDVVDGRPAVRVTVRMDFEFFYDLGLISDDGLNEDWRRQIEQIASSSDHELTITVEG